MGIQTEIRDDVGVLIVSGKLIGGEETREVHENVKKLISRGISKVVIDLSHVKWLNSKGLGMIMACFTSLKNVKGDLGLIVTTEKVKKLFMITKLIDIFDQYDTVDHALSQF